MFQVHPSTYPSTSSHLFLLGISTSQTLNLIDYIKNKKVIVLIDNENRKKFIHHQVSKQNHFYVHVVHNFQIMILNAD
jgi:hypothetical protein